MLIVWRLTGNVSIPIFNDAQYLRNLFLNCFRHVCYTRFYLLIVVQIFMASSTLLLHFKSYQCDGSKDETSPGFENKENSNRFFSYVSIPRCVPDPFVQWRRVRLVSPRQEKDGETPRRFAFQSSGVDDISERTRITGRGHGCRARSSNAIVTALGRAEPARKTIRCRSA